MTKLGWRRSVALGVALALLGSAAPARSGSNEFATGALAFEGAVDLAAGTWRGTFTGTLTGSYAADGGERIPWTLALINPADADFASVELLGCTAGTAKGRFHIATDGHNQVYGAWKNSTLPLAIVAVDATLDFEWARAGAAGVLTVTEAVVDVQVLHAEWTAYGPGPGWRRVVDTSDAQAGAATTTFEGSDPTSCTGTLKGALTGLALPLD